MGKHPLRHLLTAASGRDLSSAGDMAAALDWRLTALASTDPGPLPWLPGIPPTLRAHSAWATIWTRDQLEEEAPSIQPPLCGNSDSTGISPFHRFIRHQQA